MLAQLLHIALLLFEFLKAHQVPKPLHQRHPLEQIRCLFVGSQRFIKHSLKLVGQALFPMDLFAHFLWILIRSIRAIVLFSPILSFFLGFPEQIHVFVMSVVGNEVFWDILFDKAADCKAIPVEDMPLESDGGAAKVFAHGQHLGDCTIYLSLLAHQSYIHKYWLSAPSNHTTVYTYQSSGHYIPHSLPFKKVNLQIKSTKKRKTQHPSSNTSAHLSVLFGFG